MTAEEMDKKIREARCAVFALPMGAPDDSPEILHLRSLTAKRAEMPDRLAEQARSKAAADRRLWLRWQ